MEKFLRIGAHRWILDLFNEASHVFQEEIVHVLLIHLPQLHYAPHRRRRRCCHLELGWVVVGLTISLFLGLVVGF